jgi:hypothetical protein
MVLYLIHYAVYCQLFGDCGYFNQVKTGFLKTQALLKFAHDFFGHLFEKFDLANPGNVAKVANEALKSATDSFNKTLDLSWKLW